MVKAADCLKVVVLAQLSRARAHEPLMSMLMGLIRSTLVEITMSMLVEITMSMLMEIPMDMLVMVVRSMS